MSTVKTTMARRLFSAFLLPWLLLGASLERAEAQSPAADQPRLTPRASEILRRSMEFVSAAPVFAVTGESGNEEWREDGQMIEFGADFALAIQRPAKANIRIESHSGVAATLILDGESMSVSADSNQTFYFDTTEQPGDINTSLDQVSEELGVPRQLRAFPSKELTAQLDTMRSYMDPPD